MSLSLFLNKQQTDASAHKFYDSLNSEQYIRTLQVAIAKYENFQDLRDFLIP